MTDKENKLVLPLKRPEWLKVRPPLSSKYTEIRDMLKSLDLVTVCQEARCPNIEECWTGGTATFMLLGDTCTRGCRFCAVKTGNPKGVIDLDEPEKVGHAISKMKLDYVVLTSVNRDDLPDEGSSHFAKTVRIIKKEKPEMLVEVLTPDFHGKEDLVKIMVDAAPDVFAHNVETVERLTKKVRDRRATYKQSMDVLSMVKKLDPSRVTKTSIMLGLGESDDEVLQTLKDLREVDVDVVTFGQYLSPSKRHLPVVRYVTPEEFKNWEKVAMDLGFLYCASGPLVRSSYRAGEYFIKGMIERRQAVASLEKKMNHGVS